MDTETTRQGLKRGYKELNPFCKLLGPRRWFIGRHIIAVGLPLCIYSGYLPLPSYLSPDTIITWGGIYELAAGSLNILQYALIKLKKYIKQKRNKQEPRSTFTITKSQRLCDLS